MKSLMLPRAGLWAGSRTALLWQSIVACVAAVCRRRQHTVEARQHRTTYHFSSRGKQASSTGTFLVESDIRDGVRGIMP